MLPCLRGGVRSRLVIAVRSASIRTGRVRRGSITSSTYPRSAAMYGFAKRSVVVRDQLGAARLGVGGLRELLAEDDVDGARPAPSPPPPPTARRTRGRRRRLRVHDDVRAAVGLARDHGQLRHGRLAVGVEELGAVADDPAVLLVGTRQEPGHVDERDERDVERVARAHEARRLLRRVDVEHAREHLRLVADDADAVAVEPREPA